MDRNVTVAKSAGFCFGVERAVDQVYEQIEALKSGRTSADAAPVRAIGIPASVMGER